MLNFRSSGKYKSPLLRGELDPRIEKHRKLEEIINDDVDNWLCNLYFEVIKLPRYQRRQRWHDSLITALSVSVCLSLSVMCQYIVCVCVCVCVYVHPYIYVYLWVCVRVRLCVLWLCEWIRALSFRQHWHWHGIHIILVCWICYCPVLRSFTMLSLPRLITSASASAPYSAPSVTIIVSQKSHLKIRNRLTQAPWGSLRLPEAPLFPFIWIKMDWHIASIFWGSHFPFPLVQTDLHSASTFSCVCVCVCVCLCVWSCHVSVCAH